MNLTTCTPNPQEASSALAQENAWLREQVKRLQHQLDWFKKQLFGPKSERQVFDLAEQGELFQAADASTAQAPQEEEKRSVRSYQRGPAKKQRDEDCLNAMGLRFTADVPVQVVQNLPPELTGPNADQYEIIGTKTTYRLAQQAASYLVIQHERPVFRLKGADNKPVTTAAAFNVLDNSLADVSLLAGLLVDKFQFHLPLYRQHQRIQQAGITVSRSTLTNLVKRSIDLLRPIPLGRKNWLFCWTELGAEHLGIIQSLISTCKLHDLNPYTYLVDVLQRISQHPASKVNELTPRLWKERFADNPLRALIDPRHPQRQSSL